MAATILLRTIGGVDDKRLVLGNASVARLLSYGTDWTTLRIGLRWTIGNTGADLTGSPHLAVGLCSGTTQIYGDALTTHFVGVLSNQAAWTYSPSSPVYSAVGGGPFYPAKRIGSVLTLGTLITPYWRIDADPTAARSLFFVDITKGTPNFSFRLFAHESSSADVSLDTFLQKMQEATPSLANHAYTNAFTLAVSETDGALNAVNVYWDRATPALEISDLAVARLA